MRKIWFAAAMLALSTGFSAAQSKVDAPMNAGNAGREMAALDKICAAQPDMSKRDASFADILGKSLLLSDQQKSVLKDYQDTQAKAIADARTRLCASKPDLSSFEASLKFRQTMLEDQLTTLKAVNPKLIDFYKSLNPEQQARFDQMREHMAGRTRR